MHVSDSFLAMLGVALFLAPLNTIVGKLIRDRTEKIIALVFMDASILTGLIIIIKLLVDGYGKVKNG